MDRNAVIRRFRALQAPPLQLEFDFITAREHRYNCYLVVKKELSNVNLYYHRETEQNQIEDAVWCYNYTHNTNVQVDDIKKWLLLI